MQTKEAFHQLYTALLSIYEVREAHNVATIVFEDCFDIRRLSADEDFIHTIELAEISKRLLNHEPVQYVTQLCNFYGINLKVNKHVLIPRPETEELVYWILTDYKQERRQLDVIDIGTGSGCISVTLGKKKPSFRLFGVEYSMDAMNVTRINAKRHQVSMQFLRMSFLEKSNWEILGMFDIIVSNPPYIALDEKSVMTKNTLQHEPDMALFADGADPLVFYRCIAEFGRQHLNPMGNIYLELNEFYIEETKEIFESEDYVKSVEVKEDMQGKKRMMKVSC